MAKETQKYEVKNLRKNEGKRGLIIEKEKSGRNMRGKWDITGHQKEKTINS